MSLDPMKRTNVTAKLIALDNAIFERFGSQVPPGEDPDVQKFKALLDRSDLPAWIRTSMWEQLFDPPDP